MQKFQDSVALIGGNAVSGASVLVKTLAGVTATIYSDNGSTLAMNPLTTDANGRFSFYAADGRYSLTVSGIALTSTTVTDILLEDPADGTAGVLATDVSFAPSGTGATTGTVQDAIRAIGRSVKGFGATGDGATDDKAGLQAAVDAANAAGGGLVYVPAGTYILASSLAMKSNVTLYLMRGATLKAKAATNVNVVTCDSVSNVRIIGDGVIDGNLANQSGMISDSGEADGLRVELCTNVLIRDITVQNTKGWGVHSGGSTNVHTDNITVSGTQEKAFNYTGTCVGCSVVNSRLSSAGGGFFPAATGIEIDDGSNNIIVANNVISDTSSLGISVHSHDSDTAPYDVLVTGNIIKGAGDHAIRIAAHRDADDNVRRVTVVNNVIDGTDDGAGIAVITQGGTGTSTAEDLLISGNIINDTNDQGITVSLGKRIRIMNNELRNLGDHGIVVDGGGTNGDLTQYVHVDNNNVIDPGVLRGSADRDGIHFANSGVSGWIVNNHVEETKAAAARRMRYGVNVRDSDITDTRVEDNVVINPVTAFYNNGATRTTWGRPYVLAQSATPVSVTATTAEEALATITVPANALGTKGVLRITTLWSYTNGADDKTTRVRFSTISGTQYLNTVHTTTATFQSMVTISNITAGTQKGSFNSVNAFTTSTNAAVTSSVDTTADTTLVLTGQKETSGDTLTLERYIVELLPAW